MELYRQQGKGVLPSFTPDSKLRDPALIALDW